MVKSGMPKAIELTNQKFGKLTVIKHSHSTANGRYWLCKCECGNEKVMRHDCLRREAFPSCGCATSELKSKARTVHGLCADPTYQNWLAMMQRTTNPRHRFFKRYFSFAPCEFLKSSPLHLIIVIGHRPVGKSLDRIDNNQGYHCGQCPQCLTNGWAPNIRWATHKEQTANSNIPIYVEIDGRRLNLLDWSKVCGVGYSTMNRWYHAGTLEQKVKAIICKTT